MRAVVLLGLLSASCTYVQISPNSTAAGLQVDVGRNVAAAIVAGVLVSAAVQDAQTPATGSPLTPPMDPNRLVSEQDCTKPVDPLGNLRCK
ncbi:MAG TPA: hypothetical protein VIV54_17535 [Burkholderiales bacterium]